MTGQVKYYHDEMTAAENVHGGVGGLIPMLDSVLVNGFNSSTVTGISVASGVATVTVATGHGFAPHEVVLIEDATPSGLNGEKKVLTAVDNNTFTFDATGVADGAASGTITVKIAPLGWVKEFSGTNIAVYRASSVVGTRHYLRVDDTQTRSARVTAYESMTDIDTGSGLFPPVGDQPTGFWWHRSNLTSSGTFRRWYIIGDDDRFYIGLFFRDNDSPATPIYGAPCGFFGDIISYRSGDAYHCVLAGAQTSSATSTQPSQTWPGPGRTDDTVSNHHTAVSRDNTQISVGQQCFSSPYPPHSNQSQTSFVTGSDDYEVSYPSVVDGGLLFSSSFLFEHTATSTNWVLRGSYPGMLWIFSTSPLTDGDVLSGSPGLPGREILIKFYGEASGTSDCRIGFDLTGPWD